MSVVSSKNKLCKEICEAFGLKHVKSLDIHMEVDGMITIDAKMLVEDEQLHRLVPILKKFKLVSLEDITDVSAIGEPWKHYQKPEDQSQH